MKSILKVVAIGLLTGVTNSWADKGDQFLLAKIGFMSIELNDADPLYSVGAVYGYGITPEIAVEGELNLGLAGGEYKRTDGAGSVRDKGDYKIATLAGYGVYRVPVTESAYLKGKLGLLFESIKRNGTASDGTSTGLGLAGGVGVGTRVSETLTAEAEVTGIDQDIVFYSLGINYVFR